MAARPDISPLGFAILGLLKAKPSTGYAVRMVFEKTPMASYSSSPGSIYPAVKKLQKRHLISSESPPSRTLTLTDAGKEALDRWLRNPVDRDEIASDIGTALLRFAFLQDHPDRKLTRAFLESFENAARQHAGELKTFLKSEAAERLSPHARLAVEHGLQSIKGSADWAAHARHQLKAASKREKGK